MSDSVRGFLEVSISGCREQGGHRGSQRGCILHVNMLCTAELLKQP